MNQSSEARTLWEKVSGNLSEWYSDARGWTEEKARIGVKKVDIVGIQHNVKRTMTHLGGRVYDLLQRGEAIETDEQVKTLLSTLRQLESELASRESEIDDIRTSSTEAVPVPTTRVVENFSQAPEPLSADASATTGEEDSSDQEPPSARSLEPGGPA